MAGLLRSIRAKLTLWYSFVVLTTLGAFGIVSYVYTSEQLSENLDRSLSNEVKWVNNFIKPKASKVKPSKKFTSKKKPPPVEEPPADVDTLDEFGDADDEIWTQIYEHALINPKKTMIEVVDTSGAIIFRSFTVGEESLMIGDVPSGTVTITTVRSSAGEDLRVAATSGDRLRIYVAYPLAELKEVLENLFAIFLVLIPIALAVSVAGGWLLAYKSLRPVDLVTRTARRITAENLDQRIPSREIDDEIGRLVSTLNDMIARLHTSFGKIKQFTVDASHELRTPLTIVRGEIELALRQQKAADEYRRVLASIHEEVVRLSAIIDNLLLLSRADLGQDDVRFEDVDLQALVQELYEDGETLAAGKEISLAMLRTEPVTLKGDKIRLRQLFLNLVDNAIKYTPERGSVSLALDRENGMARVAVSDTGIGIAPEEQQRIFDRFYRVDKGRSRDMGGSGLGLSIAKWIAELHHGRIDVASVPHRGTTFTVYLPL
jgi:heavy metal sensor kinase